MEFAGRLRRAKLDGYIFPIVQLSFEFRALDFRTRPQFPGKGGSGGGWWTLA